LIRRLRGLSLGLAIFLVALAVLRWGGWWRVAEVRVLGAHHLPSESLAELTQIVSSANILRLDLRGIRDRFIADPWVKDVRVCCHPLSRKVIIYVSEREPVGRVETEGGSAVWVDAEGVVLGPADAPMLTGVREKEGRVSPQAAQAAQALERTKSELSPFLPRFDASDPDCVIARSDEGLVVLCGPIGRLPHTLAILKKLWEEHQAGLIDLSAYSEVDLRWEGQIILKPR